MKSDKLTYFPINSIIKRNPIEGKAFFRQQVVIGSESKFNDWPEGIAPMKRQTVLTIIRALFETLRLTVGTEFP